MTELLAIVALESDVILSPVPLDHAAFLGEVEVRLLGVLLKVFGLFLGHADNLAIEGWDTRRDLSILTLRYFAHLFL